jgi:hypothetical protein
MIAHSSKEVSATVDYRGFNEVDSRSLVERAAAAIVPDLRRHCAGRTMKSAVQFFAARCRFGRWYPLRMLFKNVQEL